MERLWFKIGEAATRIGVKPKDLRYWEQVIPEIRPRRSHGNLRYYHRDELPCLEHIREWLAEGLSVGDCRQLLITGQLTRGLDFGGETEAEIEAPAPAPQKANPRKPLSRSDLFPILESLKKLKVRLDTPPEADPGAKPVLDASPKGR